MAAHLSSGVTSGNGSSSASCSTNIAPRPWYRPGTGGSGFHPKDRKEAIEALSESRLPRFQAYRRSIEAARSALSELGLREKPSEHTKPALIRRLRRTLPDEALEWLDAAVVLVGDDSAYPPLLGSGGNDGRFDFSNNYAQAIVRLLTEDDSASSQSLLRGALFARSARLEQMSLAHFFRDDSPVNSQSGKSAALGNPWELVLALEGSLALAAGSGRRHGAALAGAMIAPFTASRKFFRLWR